MPVITFSVPHEKLSRIVAAMAGIYPIPTDGEGNPLFTENQWAKESIRRIVMRDVCRWERKTAADAATGAIIQDNDLLS